MIICGVYDVKADALMPHLFLFENENIAKRNLSAAFQGPVQGFDIVQRYPDDFYLVKVGDIDLHQHGTISGAPERVCCMDELIRKEEK